MNKPSLIQEIQKQVKERLLNLGYSEEQIDFLDDIVNVYFFNGVPSRIILKDGSELFL